MKDKIIKLFAKFYNSLHPKIKIAIMIFSSFVASTFTSLIIEDLTLANGNISNRYLNGFVTGLIPLLTVVYNVLQQVYVEAGTRLLAMDRDEKTLDKLQQKIDETTELRDISY